MEQYKPPVDQTQGDEPAGENPKEKGLEEFYKKRKFESALDALGDGNVDLFEHRLLEFKDGEVNEFQNGINEKDISTIQKGILTLLNKKPDEYLKNIERIICYFKLKDSFLHKSEFEEGSRGCILSLIEEGDPYAILSAKEMFGVSKEFFALDETKESANKGFVSCIEKYDSVGKILQYSNIFKIPDEVFYSKEIKEVIENKIIELLNYYNVDLYEINSFVDTFKISGENLKGLNKFREPSMVAVKNCVERGETETAKKIGEIFGIKEEFIDGLAQEQSVDGENNPDAPTTKKDEPVNEKSTEREKQREKVIEDVLKDGGVKFVMCFEHLVAKGQTQAGQAAYFEKMKNEQRMSSVQAEIVSHMTSEEEKNVSDLRKIMWKQKINEVVDIRHVEEAQYKKVVKTPGKKGILGFGKADPIMKEEYIGSKKMMHNEVVENGKNEPAVRISYYVDEKDWKSIGMGRPGQNMRVEIVVPESIADAVKQEIKDNPAFIRTLSDEVVKAKILKDPEDWEKLREHDYKIRPPYEQWDKEEGGGRIYVQDNEDIKKRGWNKNSIKKIGL